MPFDAVWVDPYVEAFKQGKVARLAGRPRKVNPYTFASELWVNPTATRMFNSWDAGWVFGSRWPVQETAE